MGSREEDVEGERQVVADGGSGQGNFRTTRLLGVLALSGVAVVALFLFLDWYIDPTKPSQRKDLIVTLAQTLAGAALLAGLYFTWRTLQVNREGQITERFTRAIEHLGNENEEIRLGGIYALERIAKDSPDDYRSVMEILSTYVRHNTRDRPGKGAWGQGVDRDEFPPHTPDIQAIIDVIGRRQRRYEVEEEGETPRLINLRNTDLRLEVLPGVNLTGVRGLTQEQLDQAHGDTSTKLPKHLERPASWRKGRFARAQEDQT